MSGPDDMAFFDAPPRERRLKRSNTAPVKKQESGGFMGLFDSLRKGTRPDRPERPEMPDRRRSRSYRDDDGRHPPEMERDGARRSRREDRRRGSVRPDTEGFMGDAAGAAAGVETEADEAEARRAARHARRGSRKVPPDSRETEAREAEERRARRKERAREQRAREEEEEERLKEEDRLREEKRARRAAREERRAREEQAAREAQAQAAAEAKAAERRERRRMREEEMIAARTSRRREREQRIPVEVFPDEREVDRRGTRTSRPYEDPNARRRRSKVAPELTREPLMTGALNRGGSAKDKISSWVYSQGDEPPEPPQIVPTLIDLPPLAGDEGGNAHSHSLSSDEEARRVLRRKAHRRAKYEEEEIDDARPRHHNSRREGVKSSSGSGDHERDREIKPAPPSADAKKPTSWFRKLTNL